MSDITSTDLFVRLIIDIIRYFHPIQDNAPSNNINHQSNPTNRSVRRRSRRHQFHSYRHFNLHNNHYRGCVILRARQITQQNRLLSAQAEQDFIEAILQARTEHQFFSRHFVPRVHTVNERPSRPSRDPESPEPETISTEFTETV
mmetsp:Transcript_19095/g.27145  ORF Transcript_19095/g.27145 Transcript_19095/m.27145 type:complete len:145 (+) Transcript_19095:82-516(+)